MKNRSGKVLGKEGSNLEDFIHMFAFPVCIDFLGWQSYIWTMGSLRKNELSPSSVSLSHWNMGVYS